jgi:hypothetical protein
MKQPRTQQQIIEELKSDIDMCLRLKDGSLTWYAKDSWYRKADAYAHELAKLTGFYVG